MLKVEQRATKRWKRKEYQWNWTATALPEKVSVARLSENYCIHRKSTNQSAESELTLENRWSKGDQNAETP